MAKVKRKTYRQLNRHRGKHKLLCHAPFTSMKISMDGRISPCCYNRSMDELYPNKSLMDIWQGAVFNSYQKSIKKRTFPLGCAICEDAVKNQEYSTVKLKQYDHLWSKNKMPVMFELALDNTCNLECVMCNGRYSSSIRRNKEKLPPIKSLFNESFREEFKAFIPHLETVVFAGGEPFLIPLYYDLWEDIIQLNPDCEISVVTNGTILNQKVKDVLNRGNFRINLSFEATTKSTYEAIRKNAIYEAVLKNMNYFGQYMTNKGETLNIPACPLKHNKNELPDLIRFCNTKNYSLNFVHVNNAYSQALFSLSKNELDTLAQFYQSQVFENKNTPVSKTNIEEFNALVLRIKQWAHDAALRETKVKTFDLKADKVETIKKQIFENVYKSLNYPEKTEKSQLLFQDFEQKFELILKKLPENYKSNHFYEQLNSLSAAVIINGVLYHHPDVMAEKCIEIFYYGNKN
jgi:MoaA/NifB/PqqE/SkfB family radical SAM enzyme